MTFQKRTAGTASLSACDEAASVVTVRRAEIEGVKMALRWNWVTLLRIARENISSEGEWRSRREVISKKVKSLNQLRWEARTLGLSLEMMMSARAKVICKKSWGRSECTFSIVATSQIEIIWCILKIIRKM